MYAWVNDNAITIRGSAVLISYKYPSHMFGRVQVFQGRLPEAQYIFQGL